MTKELNVTSLTEEEQELLRIDTNKKKFKLLTKYLDSKECEALIEKYNGKANDKLIEIETELDKRRAGEYCKAEISDLDKTLAYYDFQIELSEELGDSEAEQILKEDILENASAAYTHVTNKIEELFDVPSYSRLDLLKSNRVEYALLRSRLETIAGKYETKVEKTPNLNPYEEDEMSDEEFEAITNVK